MEIEKIRPETLRFSEAGVKSSIYQLERKVNEIIDWINGEEKRRDRAKRLL